MENCKNVINIFDVIEWNIKEGGCSQYPLSARAKVLLIAPENVGSPFKKFNYYLFKETFKKDRHQAQYWSEVTAYHLGAIMGVVIPFILPAFHHKYEKDIDGGGYIIWQVNILLGKIKTKEYIIAIHVVSC